MHDMTTAWWLVMGLGALAFLAFGVWLAIVLLRDNFTDRERRAAADILDERLARGEISLDDFEQRREDLRNEREAVFAGRT